jgi:hypothetical protein
MKVNTGMIPPFGPHFPVAPGVELKAASFDQLYAMIAKWRMENGQVPGDPRADVDKYVCGRWPRACILEKEGPPESERGKSIGSRVNNWVAITIRNQPPGGYPLVLQTEADDRAQICSDCPMNRGWVGCSNCAAGTRALSARIRRLRNTPLDNQLLGCLVFGHDNQSAVHLAQNIPPLTEGTTDLIPPGCWKRNLQ